MCKRNMGVRPIHKGEKRSYKTVSEKAQMLKLLNKYTKSKVIRKKKRKSCLTNEKDSMRSMRMMSHQTKNVIKKIKNMKRTK